MGETPADDPTLAEVVSLFDDEHVRTILAATSAEPQSVEELAERCGLSASNVYRRVGELAEADLLAERTRPRADGHHESVYVATVDAFELEFADGEVSWSVERSGTDVADELTRLWGQFDR
ncbi:helix-turn-helix domain-containing protein [Halobaculum sp. MBLA0147]|uniref:helix-turn-helix domain-containing protein n=1 Tax=Halobaculum sp. MBLA0147 TaxID=3079934 RepID=UPI00352401F6